ncbi:MAG: hypothetical protein V4726_14710 [Verrucomicrobiota bacterium]
MRILISKLSPAAVLVLAGWAVSVSAWGENQKPAPEAGVSASSGTEPSPEKAKETEPSKKETPPGSPAPEEEMEAEAETDDHSAAASAEEKPAASSDSESDEDENNHDNDGAAAFLPSREQAARAKLNALLPPGSTHRGVYYPSFRPVQPDSDAVNPLTGAPLGVDAPMDSLFKSDAVTRLDDNHVQFDRANWVQFERTPAADGTPVPSMRLEMERGVYDLKNQILMSNQPVRIENQRMAITGDSMLHDRISGLTELTGRVRIVFFAEEPDQESSKTASTPEPEPVKETAPAVSPPSLPKSASKKSAAAPASRR